MLRRPLAGLAVLACLGAACFATLSEAATREAPSGALLASAAKTSQDRLPSPRTPSAAESTQNSYATRSKSAGVRRHARTAAL